MDLKRYLAALAKTEIIEPRLVQSRASYWEKRQQSCRTPRSYKAEETDVPAAAKTVSISASANDRKDCTTIGSNCVPLH
jgi:hypothetical protein